MSAVAGMFFSVLLKKGHPDSLGHSELDIALAIRPRARSDKTSPSAPPAPRQPRSSSRYSTADRNGQGLRSLPGGPSPGSEVTIASLQSYP